MNSESTLVLYFDAPMQSWGTSSRFERRTTGSHPSRSAVTGILCAALGIERDDRPFLAKIASLKMEFLVLARKIKTRRGEMELRSVRFIDYHTVGGGYDEKDDNERQHIPRTAQDDKPKGTVLSQREYLSDARFGVLVSGDAELLRRCETALHDPKWGIWFGRKSCIPAAPVAQGIFPTRKECVTKICDLAGCSQPSRSICDADDFESTDETVMDVPVTFDRKARAEGTAFLPRRIQTVFDETFDGEMEKR